jgi:hypothetical protein
MTIIEIGMFSGRVRTLFRGEMDEPIYAMALRKIAQSSYANATRALEEYAIEFGGAKGRFFPGKFFEYLEKSSQPYARHVWSIDIDAERAAVDADWHRIRAEVAAMPAERVKGAQRYLREVCGWRGEHEGANFHTAAWILAVRDIGGSHRVEWLGRSMPAEEFYRTISARPSEMPLEASMARRPSEPTATAEGRTSDPRAVSAATERHEPRVADGDDLGF